MAEDKVYERTLEETPTWAVAVVCFVLLAISIVIEHIIHAIGKVSYAYGSFYTKGSQILIIDKALIQTRH